MSGLEVEVGEQTAADLDRPAPRPSWSVLDTDKLAAVRGKRLPEYTDALERHLALDARSQQRQDGPDQSGTLRGKRY